MNGTDPIDTLARISALLKSGQVQAADDLASATHKELTAAAAAAAGVTAPPSPPRPFNDVLTELLTVISGKFGHPADLAALLEELAALGALAG